MTTSKPKYSEPSALQRAREYKNQIDHLNHIVRLQANKIAVLQNQIKKLESKI